LYYLDVNILPYEDALEAACSRCRRLVQRKTSPIGNWRIAKKGLPEMPSAKTKIWKYDSWLPRTVAKWLATQPSNPFKLKPGEAEGWLTVAGNYANPDSTTALALYKLFQRLLEERQLIPLYEERRRLIPIVCSMERNGITASLYRGKELVERFTGIGKQANAVCENLASSYNYKLQLPKSGSNNSLTTFTFDVLKLPKLILGNKKNKKTDNPSLDKKVLNYYEDTLPQKSKALRFIKGLREKRASDTALSYITGYEKFGIRILGGDEWVVLHPGLNTTGSDTLRCTSCNPNEQNISKREGFNLRYMFGPIPGREWWSLDAKNIELRIPAYESGEAELIALFEQPDEPPYYGSTHLLNFHTIYPDIWEAELKAVGFDKVGPHCKKKYAASWYQWCKNFGFAVQYGAIERDAGEGTADIAAHKPGAQALVKARFGKLEALNQKWIEHANKTGYVETLPDARVSPHRGYPLLCTRDQWGRIKPTVPLNYHVQGTAMYWTCRAMVETQLLLDQWNREAMVRPPYKASRETYRIALQVHDEIVLDFPAGRGSQPHRTNLPKIRQIVKAMEGIGGNIGVPTPVGIEFHQHNWSEGITL
jgi:DNA polymerase I-like protein with 3'-5' exonuclease and polymerase domains